MSTEQRRTCTLSPTSQPCAPWTILPANAASPGRRNGGSAPWNACNREPPSQNDLPVLLRESRRRIRPDRAVLQLKVTGQGNEGDRLPCIGPGIRTKRAHPAPGTV